MQNARCTPQEFARVATDRLRGFSNPARAAGAERYFKHTIKTFGATSPQVRALEAELYKTIKKQWNVRDAVSLCDLLFPEPELESKAVASLILNRFKKDFPESLFYRIERWLASDFLNNWASVDLFCTDGMPALLERYPKLIGDIRKWCFHPNRWVKRASAVSFIKLARKPEFLPAIYEISESLFPVCDDLVEKANGWLLREAGKTDGKRLEEFLLRHGKAIPRTTVRYAIERFPERKRKQLLGRTRMSGTDDAK